MKRIALTYDDGPCPLDLVLMDVLRKHKVNATFFCTGEALDRDPHIARLLLREGHRIGNHTYSHPNLTQVPIEHVRVEIVKCQSAAIRATGVVPKMFRAPYVASNAVITREAQAHGLTEVMWHAAGHDWREGYRTTDIIINVISEFAGREQGIILLHDTVAATAKATDYLLSEYKARGYEFVFPDELTC